MLREGYEVTAEHEATHWWFRSRRELFLGQVACAVREGARPGRRPALLDYGCGTGFNLRFLAAYGDVTGADVADETMGEFRRADEFPRLDLRADTSAQHGRFDVVVALDVLEHCDDDAAALVAMQRFLAPQGQLVLTVPAYAWLWSGEDVVSRHRRRYTMASLLEVCRRGGLVVRYASYFNLTILPAMAAVIWTRRLLASPALAHSNLRPTPGWLNTTLHAITALEARWVGAGRRPLPAGASLVCRLGRAEEAHAAVA
jgi:SAM-dependent methyltransferase